MQLPTIERDYLNCCLRAKITNKLQVYKFNFKEIKFIFADGSICTMDEDFSRNYYEESLYRFEDMETENALEIIEIWEDLAEDMWQPQFIKNW